MNRHHPTESQLYSESNCQILQGVPSGFSFYRAVTTGIFLRLPPIKKKHDVDRSLFFSEFNLSLVFLCVPKQPKAWLLLLRFREVSSQSEVRITLSNSNKLTSCEVGPARDADSP